MRYNYSQGLIKGNVHSLESFGLVDGPGVRYVVFLQGCALRCKYCHNPETWAAGSGSQWTAKQLFDKVYRFRNYWRDNGGITVSGGEPLLQIEFLTEFFTLAKSKNIHTAIDTAGQPFCKDEHWLKGFSKLMELTDLVILDIKDWSSDKHKLLTGMGNDNIKEMAVWLSEHEKDMWIRHVLVPNLTDDEEDLKNIGEFIRTLKSVKRVEILPYHVFGIPKWEKLGIKYQLADAEVPTEDQIKRAEELIGAFNLS